MRFLKYGGMVVAGLLLTTQGAAAQQFNSGIPAGWACVGTCGALGANGDVTLAPLGGTQYGYVTSTGGVTSAGGLAHLGLGNETNGSMLTSNLFTGTAGDLLAFSFLYITSDGGGFADYAWVSLLDESFNEVALLFTARTTPGGSTVPGFGMPAPTATLDPDPVTIIDDATNWSPLGVSSGDCWDTGCGNTGWINSSYTLAAGGNFYLRFGVVNWDDEDYDSGLAFDGVTIGGVDILDPTVVPEPATMVLLATGLMGMAGVGFIRRRRQR